MSTNIWKYAQLHNSSKKHKSKPHQYHSSKRAIIKHFLYSEFDGEKLEVPIHCQCKNDAATLKNSLVVPHVKNYMTQQILGIHLKSKNTCKTLYNTGSQDHKS